MKLVKKILKIVLIVVLIAVAGLLIAARQFLKPESETEILESVTSPHTSPKISNAQYQKFNYRVLELQQEIDTALPVLIFVHGSPGSMMDFKRYLTDSLLNKRFNLVAYERIGYGPDNLGNTPAEMEVELGVLHQVVDTYGSENVVLAGYSYGGPVVLASQKNYKYKVSMASAVVGEYEPMFGVLAFYRWKMTRWMIPPKAQAAAKEKYAHREEYPNYKEQWSRSPSPVINIHGDQDWIVPYKNSEFLVSVFDRDKFRMVTIPGGGHELIWSDFDLIKEELLKTLD